MNEFLHTPLSERELEILSLVAQGKSNKEIASELFISVNTVKVHLAKIFQRIGVASRTEATLVAFRLGLVETPVGYKKTIDEHDGFSSTVNEKTVIIPSNLKTRLNTIYISVIIIFFLLITLILVLSQSQANTNRVPNSVIAEFTQDRLEFLGSSSRVRIEMTIVANEDNLFIIGGETQNGITGLSESVDLSSNSWVSLPSKPTAVANAKASILGGKIYVPGGRITESEVTNFVELYDPQLNEWSKTVSLPYGIANYALISYEGQLFLFGGTNGKEAQSSVLTFLPNTGRWIELPKLAYPAEDPFVFVQGAEVFLINEMKDTNTFTVQSNNLNNMQNSQTKWRVDERKLNIPTESQLAQVGESIYYLHSDELWKYDFSENQAILYAKLSGVNILKLLGAGNYLYFTSTDKANQKTNAGRFRVIYTITIPLLSK